MQLEEEISQGRAGMVTPGCIARDSEGSLQYDPDGIRENCEHEQYGILHDELLNKFDTVELDSKTLPEKKRKRLVRILQGQLKRAVDAEGKDAVRESARCWSEFRSGVIPRAVFVVQLPHKDLEIEWELMTTPAKQAITTRVGSNFWALGQAWHEWLKARGRMFSAVHLPGWLPFFMCTC